MKLKSYEMLLIAATLAFACFTAGFFVGRSGRGEAVMITTQHESAREIEPAPPPTEAAEETQQQSELVNINTADEDTLSQLPGIGDVLAERIVDYREEHGPYYSIFDITAVEGIGDATFENMKDYLTVGEGGE